jgi:hypothetical protein
MPIKEMIKKLQGFEEKYPAANMEIVEWDEDGNVSWYEIQGFFTEVCDSFPHGKNPPLGVVMGEVTRG